MVRKLTIQRPRGTRDFAPEEMRKRRLAEKRFADTCKTFGYGEVAMPAFEHTELFTLRSGEGVINQMYTFTDKGGRSMALRPEMTAQVMRFYDGDLRNLPKPIKLYYFGNCFRYEEPQKGRYREFWQFGAEVIGGSSPASDAEAISLAISCIKNAGLSNYELRIGNVAVLRALLSALGIDAERQPHVMPLIDKGNTEGLMKKMDEYGIDGAKKELAASLIMTKGGLEIIDKAEEALSQDAPALAAIKNWRKVIELLAASGISGYKIDIGIARGLDYYTDIVFEIDAPSLGAEKQICGGGSYSLSGVFESSAAVHSTGFALGFDRIALALEKEGTPQEAPSSAVYIAYMGGDDVRKLAFEVASALRSNSIPAHIDLSGRSFSKSFAFANTIGAQYVAAIGENELAEQTMNVKDMKTGQQEIVHTRNAVFYFKQKAKKAEERQL